MRSTTHSTQMRIVHVCHASGNRCHEDLAKKEFVLVAPPILGAKMRIASETGVEFVVDGCLFFQEILFFIFNPKKT